MWSAPQYLKFANERTRPCSDLVSQISLERPSQIIDLGCGPGNSTTVLRDRWPDAAITGLDSSPDMIATARKNEPTGRWMHADITEWAGNTPEQYDLVFSNAALHWVPDHQILYPLLFSRSNAALAVQMPASFDAPAHVLMREIAESQRWKPLFAELPQWHARSLEEYLSGVRERYRLHHGQILFPFRRTFLIAYK